ncbi:hypothetical protein [Actinomadura sp. 7K507]|uniref:hypothetical protein n=1 Tax=Actinomadura sp. 7K507 TaxID=2530365 RepID=UPI001053497F|nr:hypothetical protein [Actinomadura sp. 7K507]TDC84784.1 hypothetical protein E1285_26180 [Actinomadura sp. 7K507]
MNVQEWHMLGDPIGDGPSYYEHARRLLRRSGSGHPPKDGFPPPDWDAARRPRSPSGPELDGLLGALEDVVADWPPGREELLRLDGPLRDLHLMHERGEVRARVLAREDLPRERLHTLGRWLARTGARIGAVELGLILLGIVGNDDDGETILTLGLLEGPCCCAADALADSQSRPYEALYAMARKRRGWARIDAVKHMRGATVDGHIKDWLVREACEGNFLDVYIADIVAGAGDLAGALAADADDDVLNGAKWILIAMCDREAPTTSILDFPAAETVLTAYARRVLAGPSTLGRLQSLMFVDDFLHSGLAERARWGRHLPAVRGLYRRALSSPFAHQAIEAALTAADPATADRARLLAAYLPEAPGACS